MNAVEFTRLANQVTHLLVNAKVEAFRYNLKTLVKDTGINLPRRKVFDTVSDILTLIDVAAQSGNWVIAEIEGTEVQFMKLVNVDRNGLVYNDEEVESPVDNDNCEDEDWDDDDVGGAEAARILGQVASK